MLISVRAYLCDGCSSRLADLRALAPIGARGHISSRIDKLIPNRQLHSIAGPTCPRPCTRLAYAATLDDALCAAHGCPHLPYLRPRASLSLRSSEPFITYFRRHSESEPRWLSARLMFHPEVAQILGHIHDAGNHLGNLPPPGDGKEGIPLARMSISVEGLPFSSAFRTEGSDFRLTLKHWHNIAHVRIPCKLRWSGTTPSQKC